MTKAVFLFPFLFLLVSENLLFAKETPLRRSDKSNPNKKLHHEEKHKAVVSNKAHLPQNRNQLERCEIICPYVFPTPENCYGGPNRPVVPSVKPTTSRPSTTASTSEESTESEETEDTEDGDAESDSDAPQNNSTSQRKNLTSKSNPMKRGFTQTFRIVTSKKLKNRLGHGDRKNTYHRLSGREKHILLKQLNLGNRHGKKGYKFRQVDPLLCQVVCHVIHEEEYPSVAQPITLYEEGEDTDNEDNYEEGEDTPIEITIKPIALLDTVIGGIRPFGNVDFMGMDDFGPNGELAGDPSTMYYEDKSVRRKTEKAKPRRKAVVAEKGH